MRIFSTAVIGGGISGLVSSCFLADAGTKVSLFEKHSTLGGRARMFKKDGFSFDMGPSWYWMPDVFEDFFQHFGKTTADFYDLVKLDPGFQIILSDSDLLKVPANLEELYQTFESREKGSALKLKSFLKQAAEKYEIGMKSLVKTPSYSWLEFAKPAVIGSIGRMNLFRSVRSYVRSHFKDPALVSLLEFPVLFLGALPDKIPALYTLMNHAALTQGTYYPMGGMIKIIEACTSLAESLGVDIETDSPIDRINVTNRKVQSVHSNGFDFAADGVISSADYHYTEQHLIPKEYRNYDDKYWESRTMAPSCLIYYLGVNKKLDKLEHHNLFFDTDFEQHAREIYHNPSWPSDPLFYVCCPSRTDSTVAPEGMENLFVLIPIAAGLADSTELRDQYYDRVLGRISEFTGESLTEHIVVKESYCIDDFIADYHAFKGNAYGLANTLRQTAVLKPSLRNNKISNLFYTGQLTVPGPGLPPAIISGELAANQLIKHLKQSKYESAF